MAIMLVITGGYQQELDADETHEGDTWLWLSLENYTMKVWILQVAGALVQDPQQQPSLVSPYVK